MLYRSGNSGGVFTGRTRRGARRTLGCECVSATISTRNWLSAFGCVTITVPSF